MSNYDNLTIGQVIDTNDPQQMGRVRVLCRALGDSDDKELQQLPWAMQISPFAGVTNFGTRGTEEAESSGSVAYGMWGVPSIGAQVLVGCIDGDPSIRFWLGCLHPQFFTHTMPHGRYDWHNDEEGTPDGPLDSLEQPIQPLYDNFTEAFSSNGIVPGTPTDSRKNMEWRTRGVDRQVAALDGEIISGPHSNGSKQADHDFGNPDFTTITEEDGTPKVVDGVGYGKTNLEPDLPYDTTGNNYDSTVYSWTTPGFHSISMDDRVDNTRVRLRTTSGNQIILDDTNERIYVSTAKGKTWIEMDGDGNIDVFGEGDISIRSKQNLNFVADESIRMTAGKGIHLASDDDIRIHATGGTGVHVNSSTDIHFESSNSVHVKTTTLYLASTGNTYINTSGNAHWSSGGTMNHLSGGTMFFTGGPVIHLNGPAATAAQPADTSKQSFAPSRIPDHEPWPRVYTDPSKADKDTNNTIEFYPSSYTSTLVGRVNRNGQKVNRGKYWHR